jgi:hypothetical protein
MCDPSATRAGLRRAIAAADAIEAPLAIQLA